MAVGTYNICNEEMNVAISSNGAELQSVYSKKSGREWLWQGDASYWAKRSPILFPFVGTSTGSGYTYDNVPYGMTRHGFARDRVFGAEVLSESAVAFELRSDSETLSVYPFEFILRIVYSLEGRRLDVKYEVYNPSDRRMLFSIGGHPAFNADMDNEPWSLIFEKEEELELIPIELETGLLKRDGVPIESRISTIKKDGGQTSFELNGKIFREDALIFKDMSSIYTDLVSNRHEERLRFHHGEFPFMAFWSPEAPFVCMEPWFGHADYSDHDGTLENKEDVNVLEGGHSFSVSYGIELLDNAEVYTQKLKSKMIELGADLVGIADMKGVEAAEGFNYGISIAKRISPEIVAGLVNGPYAEYAEEYERLNEALDSYAKVLAGWLIDSGYDGDARTTDVIRWNRETRMTPLPHKTIAIHAGLGWIGKCALLVTEEFGSGIRLTSVLTNMPLVADDPTTESKCGSCRKCLDACPGDAVKGVNWKPGMDREEYYDSKRCMDEADRACRPLGIKHTICGRCIAACPYTQRSIR